MVASRKKQLYAFPESGKVPQVEHQVPAKTTGERRAGEMLAALLRHYGAQNWWPGRSRFEVIVGAFLVQNTAWKNADKALRRLRREEALHPAGIRRASLPELEEWIRPAGYFRQKAARLKSFVEFLDRRYGGSTRRMFGSGSEELRRQLMGLPGVGDETADAILLYAGGRPAFVASVYARRIAERHGLGWEGYGDVNKGFRAALSGVAKGPLSGGDPSHRPSRMSRREMSPEVRLYGEGHAVIVRVGGEFCRTEPRCAECPLAAWLPPGGVGQKTV